MSDVSLSERSDSVHTNLHWYGSRSVQRRMWHGVVYFLLSAGSIMILIPLLFMITTSLKASSIINVIPPPLLPKEFVWQNYPDALKLMNFWRSLLNTMRIVVPTVVGSVLTASMAGYAFSRIEFKGRDVLFVLVLSTIMLPWEVTLIPVFHIFKFLGWIDSLKPLQVPPFFGGSPFYIFLLRQFFSTIPQDLEDAAKIDGCSTLAIWWRIFLPLSKPVLATVAVFSFLDAWNDFFGPLIFVNSASKRPLVLSLALFRGYSKTPWNLLMAASFVCMLPPIVLYFLAQRYFIQGIVITGVKG